jgi:hypothetical protein
LEHYLKAVYGGVSWPGKHRGFAVVVAMNRFEKYGTKEHEICLLDEVESRDMWELVKQIGVLDLKYNPSVWIGDSGNPTADQFVRELNSETHGRSLSFDRTSMLDMDWPYQHMLQSLRRMLRQDSRTLYLKDSKVVEYLREIDADAEIELELGEYPAIEALAFAVLEMKNRGHSRGLTLEEIHALQKKYGKRY